MTRKHFQDLADTVRTMDVDDETRRKVANDMADFCRGQNPRFNRERFLTACGVN